MNNLAHLKLASDELHIVWAEVYCPPNVPDTEGDYMDRETIQTMAYKFMQDGRQRQIDVQHDNNLVQGACVVESFIARKGDPDFIEGAWVVGVYVPDADVWARIKKGEINGFSIEAIVSRSQTILEVDLPPIISGRTTKNAEHEHQYHVAYGEKGEFLGGKTDSVNGHFHLIKRGTITEEADGHTHRFSFVEGLSARELEI